jgi:hypothetical protein
MENGRINVNNYLMWKNDQVLFNLIAGAMATRQPQVATVTTP